ncbi:hypothetical protein GCM10029963_71840 [Micromonospora andamanensis]
MTDLVVRPLVAGEEKLFDSMPDPLPQLRQISYADGIAGGGYRPEHTFVALRGDRVVGRAAWLLLPGSVGEPWLERFDLDLAPATEAASAVGAALLRAAHDALGGPKVYHAALPAYWRRQPEVRAVAEASMAAARLAGLVERGADQAQLGGWPIASSVGPVLVPSRRRRCGDRRTGGPDRRAGRAYRRRDRPRGRRGGPGPRPAGLVDRYAARQLARRPRR